MASAGGGKISFKNPYNRKHLWMKNRIRELSEDIIEYGQTKNIKPKLRVSDLIQVQLGEPSK